MKLALPMLLLLAGACSRADSSLPAGQEATHHARSTFEVADLHEHVVPFNRRVREVPGFSDLWIEHEPAWRLIVAFTAPPARQTVLRLAPEPIRGRIEIRRAKRTQAEIGAAMDAIAAALNRGGVDYTASYSPKNERFAVTVGTAANIERARLLLPQHLRGDTDVAAGPLPVSLTPQALEPGRSSQPRR